MRATRNRIFATGWPTVNVGHVRFFRNLDAARGKARAAHALRVVTGGWRAVPAGLAALFGWLERVPRGGILLICLLLTGMVGAIDHLLIPELTTVLFYMAPVGLGAWFGSRRVGMSLAAVDALTWMLTEFTSGARYPQPFVLYCNAVLTFLVFLVIALLLSGLRSSLLRQRTLAETDDLTGAGNRRAFYERAQDEIRRARRYQRPFSVAYLDVDDFKLVNDRYGHIAGDEVLREVVAVMRTHARATDVIARLGGDEFSILLTETGVEAAASACRNITAGLRQRMRALNRPVTFSVGLVTFVRAPTGVRQLVTVADELMYSVKREGKNAMVHVTWRGMVAGMTAAGESA